MFAQTCSASTHTQLSLTQLLVMTFIGLGMGPTWVGAASDWLKATGDTHSLRTALYTLLPAYPISILLFFWLARVIRAQERTPA